MEVTSNCKVIREGGHLRVPLSEKLCTILGTRYSQIPLQIYEKDNNIALSLLSLPYEKICDVDLQYYSIQRSQNSIDVDADPQYFTINKGVFNEGEYRMTLIQQTDKLERHILCEQL
tara:strand:- start:43 stop:393 length:351 start_codon:yes stop_codon:yes gene_type:complete